MVVTCDIEFDNNPYGTYYAGQVLTGRITLKSDKAKKVKAVALKINGFAHTSWSESSSHSTTHNGKSTTETRTTHYSGHEDYVASITYVLGSEASQMVYIEPGIHVYTFACHIPPTCPSSFEGIHGHIRYTVKVALIRPWKFDQTYTKGFTVLKVMDLNYHSPLLRVPANTEVQKTFCCGPCKSQPLQIHLNLPQSGYVPGQHIPIAVLVTNDSNIAVEEIKVELAMLVCYYSQSPCTQTKQQRIVLTKQKGDPVPRNCKKQFNYALLVPATPPTCFNLCRIVQIAYQVEVEAKVKGMHANQVLCMPVTIGNVPLMGVIQQQPTSSGMVGMQRGISMGGEQPTVSTIDVNENSTDMENAGVNSNARKFAMINEAATSPTSPWGADANIPPPAYEEAVHMQHAKIIADEPHDYGQTDFAPRYPVFHIPSPNAPTLDEFDGNFENGISNGKSTWL